MEKFASHVCTWYILLYFEYKHPLYILGKKFVVAAIAVCFF